ncbi:hypothetical protein HY989_04575 [Candidatus Micrarchaeota archaeon]|nr:hypothetical protein [Candidatus Micrarchaeota archaeon]
MDEKHEMIVLYSLFFGPPFVLLFFGNSIFESDLLKAIVSFLWMAIFSIIGYFRKKFIKLRKRGEIGEFGLLEGSEAQTLAWKLSIIFGLTSLFMFLIYAFVLAK